MIIRLDKFGRFVLPLKLRKMLGLKSGSEVEVEVTEEGLVLKPRDSAGKLVRKHGILVWTGPTWDEDFDPVKADREARDAKLLGE